MLAKLGLCSQRGPANAEVRAFIAGLPAMSGSGTTHPSLFVHVPHSCLHACCAKVLAEYDLQLCASSKKKRLPRGRSTRPGCKLHLTLTQTQRRSPPPPAPHLQAWCTSRSWALKLVFAARMMLRSPPEQVHILTASPAPPICKPDVLLDHGHWKAHFSSPKMLRSPPCYKVHILTASPADIKEKGLGGGAES